MKKLIIFLSISSFFLTKCIAQNKIQVGEIKAKHANFSVKKSSMDFGKGHPYLVLSSKNKYEHGVPHPKNGALPVLKSDFHVNENEIREIVYNALANIKEELHDHNESLSIYFVFETNGQVADVYYTLSENTIITTKELDTIDARLRTEVKAKFTGRDYKDYIAVNYPYLKPIAF